MIALHGHIHFKIKRGCMPIKANVKEMCSRSVMDVVTIFNQQYLKLVVQLVTAHMTWFLAVVRMVPITILM